MNPYLEHPSLWPEVHGGLIEEMLRTLNRSITPKYRAAMEQRVYQDALLIGIPDVTVSEQSQKRYVKTSQSMAVLSRPERVSIPIVEKIKERYLEVREVATNRVITVVEILSPTNKREGEGRSQYLRKRQAVLGGQSHFIEIDLLRNGTPMPVKGGRQSSYQILVSRSDERPIAERYPFNLREHIPIFSLPLLPEDDEPVVNLKDIIDRTCEGHALDLSIAYSRPPVPPLNEADWQWIQSLPTAELG
ncbi:MAG: DUF4058 family protein [Cyanobacteria bacterium J06648_16]